MSGRIAGWSAWGMWALTVLATALMLLLASLNEPHSSFRNAAVTSLLIQAFPTVGALVASRRPENPIGWLFLSGGFMWILGFAPERQTLPKEPWATPSAHTVGRDQRDQIAGSGEREWTFGQHRELDHGASRRRDR